MGHVEDNLYAANKMRQEWAANDALRDAGLTEPDNIEKLLNISYTTSDTKEEEIWHLTDIYYPKGTDEERLPVIVSIHGGGWFYGDKELYRFYTMHLATKGFAVVNFNYRRSPEYQYPAGFEDVCHLMSFLAKHSEEYRLDMKRLFLVGDSAGAQLASQYCIYATNSDYRGLFEMPENMAVPVPEKTALNCGIYDLGEMFLENTEIAQWYLPPVLRKELEISIFRIMEFMTKDFPPVYLMTSVNDSLSKHTLPMKQKLEELNIPFCYREFGKDVPEDGHVFHLNMRSENGMRCNEEEIAFLRKRW